MSRCRRSTPVWVLALLLALLGLTVVHARPARAGTDDYPVALKAAAKDSVVDPWRFYNRECTSFVAWRLNQGGYAFQNFTGGQQYGDAVHWGVAAKALGIPVDSNPTVGSVAWTTTGQGHVAMVETVNTDGTVKLEEYNATTVGAYDERTVPASAYQYIHFHDLAPTFPDGTFLRDSADGSIWLVAGGSPTWVSTWDPFGGPQPTTDITAAQLALMPIAPRDGTFLVGQGRGDVWRVAGGSAIAIPDWSAFGGPQPTTTVDPWVLDHPGDPRSHLLVLPRDGTVVSGLPSQALFTVKRGRLSTGGAIASAVVVADPGLSRFPAALTTTPVALHVIVGRSAVVPLLGTGFIPGTSVTTSRTDLHLAATTVVDSTQVVTSVVTSKTSKLGAQNLTVTGPDGATTVCRGCLIVDPIPVAAVTHVVSLLAFTGDLRRSAVLQLTGKGVTIVSKTSMGHGHYRLSVRVQKGTVQSLRNLRVLVGGRAVKTLVHLTTL